MGGPSLEPIRVLHVDDDPDFADLTMAFLERESDSFDIETATSATSGLAVIEGRKPDCVVSDYDMPGTNGLEFLETIRETYTDLPFILFTGKGSEQIGRVAKPSRVCLWCPQLRVHSSLLFWSIAGEVRRGTTGSTLDQRTSPAEAGVSPLIPPMSSASTGSYIAC